ncbi:uncharacterized protein L969DRAFT_104645 [Mixia osmundae IAM 14324]|uniref:non-specific serine/threonine protein kinase n=1 Tax=Mixia osmundae (strain CBS 9802 / IAM 14324 / JCM 22182 / KY 12970) TaxID=764103 RepID=G7DWP3_MIXOS|nr:uncharacterized protein L969DRAFT_104645 [Mixia osmundae IAM 14324]KEI38039.1 hypothetical protein L969DRAFT_104645 [Mixia osmundae IAM 14324]GAA95155.1 hypothetical protein E5Q_01810 [Mixia osmundae IAM 14324]
MASLQGPLSLSDDALHHRQALAELKTRQPGSNALGGSIAAHHDLLDRALAPSPADEQIDQQALDEATLRQRPKITARPLSDMLATTNTSPVDALPPPLHNADRPTPPAEPEGLHHHLTQALAADAAPGSVISPGEETIGSGASSLSRMSSVTSTDSVQAVPIRTPASRLMSRQSSAQAAGSAGGYFSSRFGGQNANLPVLTPGALPSGRPVVSGGGWTPGQSATTSRRNSHVDMLTGAELTADQMPVLPGPPLTPQTSNFPGQLQLTPGLLRTPRQGMVESRRASQTSINGMAVPRKSAADFEFGDILGEGSYSTVFAATDKLPPHRQYALKILDKRHIVKEKKIKYVNIEKDTLNRLERHPGIVRLFWTFHDESSLYFVLELAENGEILKYIKQNGSFDVISARYYSAQILSALEHIHSRGVLHRDLKPENILLDAHMRIKITDFGTAKLLDPTSSEAGGNDATMERANSFVGTAEYVSPELLTEKTAFKSSDYWAFGCIVYQMLAGRPPFKAANEYLTFQKIVKRDYTFPEDFPADAKDLVERLLVLDPMLRLGASPPSGIQAIKQHSFFDSIDYETIWTILPPSIQTGITPPLPSPQLKLFEDFGALPIDDSDEESEPADSPRNSRRPSQVQVAREDNHASSQPKASAVIAEVESNGSKWSNVLKPRELLVYSSEILDRSALFRKRRSLILTSFPRLLCVKENRTTVKVKCEITFPEQGLAQVQQTRSRGHQTKTANEATLSSNCLIDIFEESSKVFSVRTLAKLYRFEDPSGQSQRWAAELREVATGGGKGLSPPA